MALILHSFNSLEPSSSYGSDYILGESFGSLQVRLPIGQAQEYSLKKFNFATYFEPINLGSRFMLCGYASFGELGS